MKNDIDFIKAFFYSLNENNIKYCILRKTEEILNGEAHDIDMVIDYKKLNDVFIILEGISKNMGWNLFLKSTKDNGNLITMHYYYTNENKINIVHFDLFKNFSWDNVVLIENEQLLSNCICIDGIYSCSKINEAITKFLSRYLYHGYVKDEYKKDIVEIFINNRSEILSNMERILNKEYSEKIYYYVVNEDWKNINNLNKDVRENIKKKYFTSYYKRINSKLNNLLFKIKRYFTPNGVMIAFLGTDGSGKSTIIDNLPSALGKTFNKSQIKYYHWRPKYLKSPKGENVINENIVDPHNKKPYNKLISFCKFMYFNLDYILGYWFSVKVYLGKNQLVVFDRYYYDYLIDKYRYRLDLSDNFIKMVMGIIPKPDITFLLTGNAEVLYERKKEISLAEVKNQLSKIDEIKDRIPNGVLVDVNKDIDSVIFDVSKNIVSFMDRRRNYS